MNPHEFVKMRPYEIAFVRELAVRFPGLGAPLAEHIEENFGEVLPHVFFYEITEYAVSLANSEELPQRRELRALLNYLEETYGSQEQLQELISVSFLENLPRPDEAASHIRAMLGPHLKRQLDVIG
jgi:hypothetical protein